jgi:hypothetical protein
MDNNTSNELSRAGLNTTTPALLEGAGPASDAQTDKVLQGMAHFTASVVPVFGRSGLNFLQMSHNEPPVFNTLDLTRSSVLSRMLVVSGNPGDAMQLVNLSSWTVAAAQSAQALTAAYGHVHQFLAGHAYKAYSLYGATVFVDEAIEVHDAPVRTDAPPAKSQIFSIEELFGSQGAAPEGCMPTKRLCCATWLPKRPKAPSPKA